MDPSTGFSAEAIRYFWDFVDIATLRTLSGNRSNSVDFMPNTNSNFNPDLTDQVI